MDAKFIVDLWNFFVLLHWTFWICLIVFIATRKKWSWRVRGSILSAIALFFIFFVFIPMHEYNEKKAKERAEWKACRQRNYDYFHKKCAEDSGRFVYKPVNEPQDSVYMMKPRKGATIEELRDQFWMGDPYGGTSILDMSGLESLLIGSSGKNITEIPGVSFVEVPDLDNPKQLWYYSLKPTGKMVQENRSATNLRPEMKPVRKPIDILQSNYGYTWDDLSTQEDREYWVAKSRLQIIDLKTHEVIAERIGYVIEEGFGSTANFRSMPWAYTSAGNPDAKRWERNFCPEKGSTTDERWILSVLHNIPFDE